MKSRIRSIKFAFVFLAAAVPLANAQQDDPAAASLDLRTLIAQAMDQNTDLVVKDQPLVQAFEQISEQTGLPVVIDPASVELLPYGQETRVSLTIKGYPLREGLRRLLAPIGMTFEPLPDKVLIEAQPALRRIGRQASWQELSLLEQLTGKPFSEVADTLQMQFQVDAKNDPRAQILAKAKTAGAGTAAQVLDIATEALGWTWHPSQDRILILSRKQETTRRLQKLCTLKYQRRNIGEILIELGSLAGVKVVFDPAAIMKLPVNTRESFSLLAENVSVQQAFELICGNTGLQYEVEQDTVHFTGGTTMPAQTPLAAERQPYVGKITVRDEAANLLFEFFVRESDLPAGLNRVRKEKIKEAIEAMNKAYGQ